MGRLRRSDQSEAVPRNRLEDVWLTWEKEGLSEMRKGFRRAQSKAF